MVVHKNDLHNLVERLYGSDQKTAFDFLQYLVERPSKNTLTWDEIDAQEPDDEPLSEEELRQLNSDTGYVSGEEAKREFGLQVDLPERCGEIHHKI
ncbi:hypothetical protein [Ferroacidibacillus organovorans]|uniref:Uncharacterized protein n=1 Tax=Ferroacidibacillus organovorans TaxID=1765683 RepID=A0A1V4EUS2_9BACL|nr:hypothetical protein [Ferroacidibacillus organovorans]OPG16686.1 hypothetical protein B2M26_05370 [Ferroacidibacillus organovorans]